jgi:hypothetical protein
MLIPDFIMLSIGIVGLPNVGKSTLFTAITKKQTDIQNYPFTTIDPNVGVVNVPDERLEKLTQFSNSEKTVPATIEFTDIAGLVKGAAQGEGLGNKFLSNIRETDLIAEVVRAFEDKNVHHVHGEIDPENDIGVINAELIIADLETIEKRIEKTEKSLRSGAKDAEKEMEMLKKFQEALNNEKIISSLDSNEDEKKFAKSLNLLTAKKFIYVLNVSEEQLRNKWEPGEKLKEIIGNDYIILSAKTEHTLSEFDPEEQEEYLKDLGLEQSGLDRLAKVGYDALDLITFLTTGEDESRAWTTRRNTKIPEAVSVIHTDFQEKFIKANVIHYDELIAAGSEAQARELGKMRIEGKEYIVKDGDVIEVKI